MRQAAANFAPKVAVAVMLACGAEPGPNINGVWTGVAEEGRGDPWTLEITDSNNKLDGTYTTTNPDPVGSPTITGRISGRYDHPAVSVRLVVLFHGAPVHWDCEYAATVNGDRDSMSGTVDCYLGFYHVFSHPLTLARE